MRYDTVIYDLDGTLLNTLDDLAAAVNHAMAQGGYPQHTAAQVAAMLGNGMENLIRRALPGDASQEAFEQALAVFKAYYGQHSADLTAPYPGVLDLLCELDALGVRQAVVSNKGDPFVKALCKQYFGGFITAAVGEQPGVRRKPAPDSVHKVMADFGCDPARTLYVGDSEVDILTAQNAGLDCVCLSWGFRTREQLLENGAGLIADTAEQLKKAIIE